MRGFEVIEGGLGRGGGGGGCGGAFRSLHPRRRKQTNKAGLKKKVKVAKEKQHVSASTITTKQPLFQTCLKN